jgi:hypothetical protein
MGIAFGNFATCSPTELSELPFIVYARSPSRKMGPAVGNAGTQRLFREFSRIARQLLLRLFFLTSPYAAQPTIVKIKPKSPNKVDGFIFVMGETLATCKAFSTIINDYFDDKRNRLIESFLQVCV